MKRSKTKTLVSVALLCLASMVGLEAQQTVETFNPALTAQVLVNVARASMRLQPGCYTMPEIPVIDLLPGTREEIVATLV